MGLQENLVKETYACGFENSFAIQHMAFLLFCKGLEVNQHVQSGTGFTESHQKVSCNSRIKASREANKTTSTDCWKQRTSVN
ncbi:eukaryotic initiation factor 4A-13-like [Nicotiana tabacum]|uniref:Eukaryotic initiation factor 4A-13-like n=3 Tax=Nicotiana tabacum TaxID=4097 RepID=A0AC58T2F8_TOBAC|nr:eukaryotic initiation factor 4A-13-like [Nicotiana tomentosiformis]XP_016480391.1 PREDICTED: eukaryotic initiation factor 4A-13-like [Nicotiana tabacum]